jgi:hypothetical protein
MATLMMSRLRILRSSVDLPDGDETAFVGSIDSSSLFSEPVVKTISSSIFQREYRRSAGAGQVPEVISRGHILLHDPL